MNDSRLQKITIPFITLEKLSNLIKYKKCELYLEPLHHRVKNKPNTILG